MSRFEADPSTVLVVNESSMLFRIQSTSDSARWYLVSIQSNYCECPDWSPDCKHLYGIRLIIKGHFPHLHSIFPILDNVHAIGEMQAQEDDPNEDEQADVREMEVHASSSQKLISDEDLLASIQDFKKVLEKIEEDLPKFSCEMKESTLQQLKISKDNLLNMLTPKKIDLPTKGGIQKIQLHVTQTRLGHGIKHIAHSNVEVEPCSSQPTKRACTGVLRRKHQRGRNRVRFEKRSRIYCFHCCSKTLLVDPLETVSCHTCHALLPLSQRHAPNGSQTHLLNRFVQVCDSHRSFCAILTACNYGEGQDDERHFTLTLPTGEIVENVFASQVGIMLLYCP